MIIDLAGFDIQSEEFRAAMKAGWVHTLDRGDLTVYFLDSNHMRRVIRNAIAALMGRQKHVRFFKNYREALDHIFLQIILESQSQRKNK